ncbi:uridine kinase [Streptomyces sp. NPDC003300]|uniref:uridine kinase n=1 Tax=unclassified Streptomyces TaxID=2593676 RepID=UPI0033A0F770
MQLTPITWSRLADTLAERIADATAGVSADGPGPWWRVAVDGADAARPGDLADAVAAALPALGRRALRVRAADFLRPASLRYEYGHQDADAYYQLWLDTGALRREVLDPLGTGGSGRVLPTLWDAATDRATRADYVRLPPGGVLVLDGPLLLGQGLPFDLTVHLRLSPAALERRTAQADRWTLPAFDRYDREAMPEQTADVLVRADDPRHPAWTG